MSKQQTERARLLAKRLNGKRILVVDDETDLLEIFREHFECLGAEVFTAENGTFALQMFFTHRPDAVVSDVRMPGGDGIELLKQVRAWEVSQSRPRTDIYFVSGFADVTSEEVLRFGGQGMLSKPIGLKQLNDLLSKTFKTLKD